MKSTTPNILVPIGLSEQSLVALEQAGSLASKINSELTLLKVIEESWTVTKLFTENIENEVKKEIQASLDKLADESSEKYGVKVNTMIAKGKPYAKIVEVAEMINATFIVMGANANISKKYTFVGSNTLRVVRETTCPVISVRGKNPHGAINNIVLPLDLTKETKQKVGKTIAFARTFGATVRVVSVLLTLDEFIVNRLTRQLNQVKSFIENEGVEVTAEIVKGIAGEERLSDVIVDYANKVDGDLIVVMTQQEDDLTPFFIGSAATEIINLSDIPVLSIVPSI